jgi:hypothetical protein
MADIPCDVDVVYYKDKYNLDMNDRKSIEKHYEIVGRELGYFPNRTMEAYCCKLKNFDSDYYRKKYLLWENNNEINPLKHWQKIGFKKGNFVNHCDESNIHIAYLCKCKGTNMTSSEELSLDSQEYETNNSYSSINQCNCDSHNCKHKIESFDEKQKKKYFDSEIFSIVKNKNDRCVYSDDNSFVFSNVDDQSENEISISCGTNETFNSKCKYVNSDDSVSLDKKSITVEKTLTDENYFDENNFTESSKEFKVSHLEDSKSVGEIDNWGNLSWESNSSMNSVRTSSKCSPNDSSLNDLSNLSQNSSKNSFEIPSSSDLQNITEDNIDDKNENIQIDIRTFPEKIFYGIYNCLGKIISYPIANISSIDEQEINDITEQEKNNITKKETVNTIKQPLIKNQNKKNNCENIFDSEYLDKDHIATHSVSTIDLTNSETEEENTCDVCCGGNNVEIKFMNDKKLENKCENNKKKGYINESVEINGGENFSRMVMNSELIESINKYVSDHQMGIIDRNIGVSISYFEMCEIYLGNILKLLKISYECFIDLSSPGIEIIKYNSIRIRISTFLIEIQNIVDKSYYNNIPIFYKKDNRRKMPKYIKFPVFVCMDEIANNFFRKALSNNDIYLKIPLMKMSLDNMKLDLYILPPLSKGQIMTPKTNPMPPENSPIGRNPRKGLYQGSGMEKNWDINTHLSVFKKAIYRTAMYMELVKNYKEIMGLRKETFTKIKNRDFN